MSGMIIAQEFHRRSPVSRTEEILQHRRQDQGQSKGIQGHKRRAESRPSTEVIPFYRERKNMTDSDIIKYTYKKPTKVGDEILEMDRKLDIHKNDLLTTLKKN